MPWMSAAANVEFVLRPFMDKPGRTAAALEALEAVGLADSASHFPDQLVGRHASPGCPGPGFCFSVQGHSSG
jgi:ABC-type nitrate/sulfonate/bicarbonate transport system ATPase subunit